MSRARKALSKCHDQGIQINAVPKEIRIFKPSSVSVASLERISWLERSAEKRKEREDRQGMMVVMSISSKYRYISELVLVFGLGQG